MTIYLTDDTLGRLDLGPTQAQIDSGECANNGYVVTGWSIGFPAVRAVSRVRALQDGTVDDTGFVGARAVSAAITIDQNQGCVQTFLDRLMPYLSPRYRPRLHWRVPGASCAVRSGIVRGVDGPVEIAGPKFHVVGAQWVMVDGMLEAAEETCQTITPSGDVEAGRHYGTGDPDDEFGPYYTNDSGEVGRAYPESLGVGARIVNNAGTAVTDWTATIFGPITEPELVVNGVSINFNRGAGLALSAGASVTINTKERTILLNNDPAESRYSVVNFPDWSWEQVRLRPGTNLLRLAGDTVGASASVEMCWRSAFF